MSYRAACMQRDSAYRLELIALCFCENLVELILRRRKISPDQVRISESNLHSECGSFVTCGFREVFCSRVSAGGSFPIARAPCR